ncbi:hypothetical protein TX23_24085 [Pseudomonas paralactis]|uniref:Uncharacterized protein n=1 Tax=Pseudomonas paralactis TaxID=1615673 RepID=A0A0R3A877_9PSED|nr:hypothetical protein TX23_24085 [Pseudomonas paralactis]
MQIAKILNAPRVRRYFYTVVLQGLWNQVAIWAKYDRRDDHPRIIMQPLLECGGSKVRRGRIAFFSQWPAGLYIRSMAHSAPLEIERFAIAVFRYGQ